MRLQIVFQEVVPLEDSILIAVHETSARLNVESRLLLLDLLQLARGVNNNVPAAGFLADGFVVFFKAIDSKSDCYVQLRTLFQNSRYIRNDALLNLSIRHEVNGLEPVVFMKCPRHVRQILASERFTARDDQDAEISA